MSGDIHDDKVKDLEQKAEQAREILINTLLEAGSGHSAGPLDMADVFIAFYFQNIG